MEEHLWEFCPFSDNHDSSCGSQDADNLHFGRHQRIAISTANREAGSCPAGKRFEPGLKSKVCRDKQELGKVSCILVLSEHAQIV